MNDLILPRPVARLRSETAYAPGRTACPVDLRLDGNEGRVPPRGLLDNLAARGPEVVRRYPDRADLESALAGRVGLDPAAVLVTAGADDALDRLCRAYLEPGRNLVVATPTFEMIPRYARLAGAEVRTTTWPRDGFPVDQVLALADGDTGIIAVVTPNNPTGLVASADDLKRLSEGAPGALLLVDLAYGEFADEDLMPTVLDLPNAVGVRSLSKAWGLAGLRVGWAAGPVDLIAPLRAAGGPYAVSGPSLQMALASLSEDAGVLDFTVAIRREREQLAADLSSLGGQAVPSQGNFVYASFPDPAWVRDGLAGLGIGVRLFDAAPGPGPVRISCPGNERDFGRLRDGLKTVLAPEALLFDMDGVLADVSVSYRRAILETAASFGETFTTSDVAEAKRKPGSNNDWVLTQGLLESRGVAVDLDAIVDRFQEIYLGLADQEQLIPDRALLERLADRLPLAVVTGRPGADARIFLERLGLVDLFRSVVCLEDAPGKPDPAPVNLAMASLGVSRTWLVGDTVNDVLAARAAGVVPLGVVPPGEDFPGYRELLIRAGAGRVLESLSELEEVLPS
jgi:histidinol-phosphate aminotransferase